MIPDPPLHVLEAARKTFDIMYVPDKDWLYDAEMEAIRDVLDRRIEEKRHERDLVRAGGAS